MRNLASGVTVLSRAVVIASVGIGLTACLQGPPRDAVPEAVAPGLAQVNGYPLDIRVWGDSSAAFPKERLAQLRAQRIAMNIGEFDIKRLGHRCTCAYVASSALALAIIADSSRGQSSIAWRLTTPRRSINVGTLVTVWRMPYSSLSWLLIGRSFG